MRRSRIVAAGLAGTVAALLAGCHQSETADCVDARGNILPDSACQGYNGGGYGGGYGGGNVIIVHGGGGGHWVYGGSVVTSGGGRRISGGSSSPSGDGEISSRSGATVRGGFGRGGGGHGGGHGG